MRKKIVTAIFALIGLGSLVVLGSSPEFVSNLLDSVQNNPIPGVFSTEAKNESETSTLRNSESVSTRLLTTATPLPLESPIPDYVLYDSLFRMDISFRGKALGQQLAGQNVTSLRHFFKDEAKLSDEQDRILEQTAIDFIQAVEPIDAQARQILAKVRGQFPDGVIPIGQQLPPPAAELTDLQSKRNEIALSYRDKLSDSLGKEVFGEFDEYIHKSFISNFQFNGGKK